MRRKSTRNATKASPEKPADAPTRRSRRHSKRRKRSTSESSQEDSDDAPLAQTIQKSQPTPVEGDATEKGSDDADQVWSVKPSQSASQSGEIQKLKICLTRPLISSPEKIQSELSPPSRRQRQHKSSSNHEDDVTSSEDVITATTTRKSRHRGKISEEREIDDQEDKKGKGKSKSKNKSKHEKSQELEQEISYETPNEISENVQVTPQSPQAAINIRVDNESVSKNECEKVINQESNSISQSREIHDATVEENSGSYQTNILKEESDKSAELPHLTKTCEEPLQQTEKDNDSQNAPALEVEDKSSPPHLEAEICEVQTKQVSITEEECVPISKEEQVSKAEEEQVFVAEEEQVPVAEEEQVSVAEEEQFSGVEKERVPVAEKEQIPVAEEQVSVVEEKQIPATELDQISTTEKMQVLITEQMSLTSNEPITTEQSSVMEPDQKTAEEAEQTILDYEPSLEQSLLSEAEKVDKEEEVKASETKETYSSEEEQQSAKESNSQIKDVKAEKSFSETVIKESGEKKQANIELMDIDQVEENNEKATENLKESEGDEEKVNNCTKQTNLSATQDELKSGEISSEEQDKQDTSKKETIYVDNAVIKEKPSIRLVKSNVTSRIINLKRNISTDSEQSLNKICKRKWGSSQVGLELTKPISYTISVDVIKQFCPNIQLLQEEEVKFDPVLTTRKVSESERRLSDTRKDFQSEEMSRLTSQTSVNSTLSESEMKKESVEEEEKLNIIAMNRKISIVDDTASKLKPPPSPAKNPLSQVLFITNLVRPFTLKQLKELLERTGKIAENGFWTDKIKSKCYVCYESIDEAEATRNALHGVNWPIGNGKKLIIDYSTVDDLEKARNPTPPSPAVEVLPKVVEQETSLTPHQIKKSKIEEEHIIKEREAHKVEMHVREWDIGKEDLHRRSRSREHLGRNDRMDRSERRKHKRSPSPLDNLINKKFLKKDDEPPLKLMDDLFIKTQTMPSIYWLPLSPEEIATKQQQRLLRMAEHKRRMEESSRNRGDYGGGRGAPYRRRYD